MAGRPPKKGLHRRPPRSPLGARFGPQEQALLALVLPDVEKLVGEHFRLTSFGPVRRCYEVVTLEGAEPQGLAPKALAKLCRYDRAERPIEGGEKVARFYRIYLQDDNLLARASGEAGASLRSLLYYVLAHELVHVVRFESYEVLYWTNGVAKEAEEMRVHELTRAVLAPLRDDEVTEVALALASSGVDVVEERG